MEEYYPSEIARLVLGYLKEVECQCSWNAFVQESFDLKEYYRLYKEGRVYTTNVNGLSLLEILREYCALKDKAVNENNQSKDSNNNCPSYEGDKTSSRISENAYTTSTVDRMVQTSESTDLSQTPKRKSKCRVSQLNFDHETECNNLKLDAEFVNNTSDSSAPNDTVITVAVTENISDVENQETHQTIPTTNKSDAQINATDRITELHNETFDQVNKIPCTMNLDTKNDFKRQEVISCNREATKPTNSEHQVSVSFVDETCDDFNNNFRTLKKCSQYLNSTENELGVHKECQSARSENTFGNVSALVHEPCNNLSSNSSAQNECNQDVNSVEYKTDVHYKCRSNLDSTRSKIQNVADLISMNRSGESNGEVTKLSSRNKVQLDTVSNPEINALHNDTESALTPVANMGNNVKSVNDQIMSLDAENNPDSNNQEEISYDKEAAKVTNSETQDNISAVVTGSTHQTDAFGNVTALVDETCNNLNNNSKASKECSQDFKSTKYESVVLKCQHDLDSAKSEIQNACDNVFALSHESSNDLTSSSEAQKECNQGLNSMEYETGVHDQCQSDLDSAISKSQNSTVVSKDLININSNVEGDVSVMKLDSRNKLQLDNVADPKSSTLLHNNTQNILAQNNTVGNNGKSDNNQTTGAVVRSVLSNKPSSGLAMQYPIIPTLQSCPTSSIQNNSQCQIYVVLPVQTIPTMNVINPMIPPPVTVVTSVENRNVAKKENSSISSTSAGENSALFIGSPIKQAVFSPSKSAGENSALFIGSPIKQAVFSPKKTAKQETASTIPTLKQNKPVSPKIPTKKTGKRSLSSCKLNAVASEVDTPPPKKIQKASKKRKKQQKDLTKQKKLDEKEPVSSSKPCKQNPKRKPLSSIVSAPSTSISEKTSLCKDLDSSRVLTCPSSPNHSNQSAAFKSTSEITYHHNIVKNRIWKVVLSDVCKSSHADFIDNEHNKNRLVKSCMQKKISQPVRHSEKTDKNSCQSSSADYNLVHEKKNVAKNILSDTSTVRSKRNVDSLKKVNNFESSATNMVTDKCNNVKATEFTITVEKCQSDVPNTEEIDSKSLGSTNTLVTTVTNSVENCLSEEPESSEVVTVNDSEGKNNEEGVNIPLNFKADQESFLLGEDTMQQSQNDKCHSEKYAEPINKENVTLEVSSVGISNSIKHKLTLDHLESVKRVEQNSFDRINIEKEMINVNSEVPAVLPNEFGSERDDLDSSRSLLINTSFNEEENVEVVSIYSDSEDSSNPVNRPDCCSNFSAEDNSNDIGSPSSIKMSSVSLHNEEQKTRLTNINEKFSSQCSSSIFSNEEQWVLPNSSHHAQNINLNSNVEDFVYDQKYGKSSNCLTKSNLHLPQGIVHIVKCIDSQKKLNRKKSVSNTIAHKDEETSKGKNSSAIDRTLNFVQTTNTYNGVQKGHPEQILDLSVKGNSVKVSDENSEASRMLIQHMNSSTATEKDLNNVMKDNKIKLNVEKKKATLSSELSEKIKVFSSTSSPNAEMSVSVADNSLHLPTSKTKLINDSAIFNFSHDTCKIMPFKKRMRHRSYDSSFNHNCDVHLLLGQSMIKSKSATSLGNICEKEIYKTGTSRKYISADSTEKSNETVKVFMPNTTSECSSINSETKTTSLNIQQNTLDSNPISENSISLFSDAQEHAEAILFKEASQSTIKAQQINFHKLSAKEFLLQEDSNSGEDSSSPVKVHQINTDKVSCKRKLLNKNLQTSVQKPDSDNFTAKKQYIRKISQPPVEVQQIVASGIENTCNRLEENENESKGKISNDEYIPGRDECIHTNFEEKTINGSCKQISFKECNVSPEMGEAWGISRSVHEGNFEDENKPCSIVGFKRKSGESFLTNRCSTIIGSSDDKEIAPEEDHYLDNNEFYTNNFVMIKRQKISSSVDGNCSPEKDDNFSNTSEPEIPYLSSNECPAKDNQGKSFLHIGLALDRSSLLKSIETGVARDSPVRYVSNTKKGTYKSALRKRIEKDPNIPAGVKIPSRWNSSNVSKYSHAIGHSINPKRSNVAGKKARQSRPTLKIATIQSPSKGQSNDKKNHPQTSCTQNCVSEGPASRNTVCNWVSKEKKELYFQTTAKKSTKKSNKKGAKLGNKGSLMVPQSIDEDKVPTVSKKSLKAHNQVCDEKVLVENVQLNNVFDHCETTQDIVEADIGRSDQSGSELANAIAGVERELLNLPPNSSHESPKDKIECVLSREEKSSAISDDCDPEGAEDKNPLEFVAHNSRMIPSAMQKMPVENVAQNPIIEAKTVQQSLVNNSNAQTSSNKSPLGYEIEQKTTEVESENQSKTVADVRKMDLVLSLVKSMGLDKFLDFVRDKQSKE